MVIYPEFRELFKCLNSRGVEYVVIGGYAMGHHGVPRATKDIDLLIHAEPASAPKVLAALEDFGFGGLGLTEADFAEPRHFLRFGRTPTQVDILTEIPGVMWDEVWRSRSRGHYGDVPVDYIGREAFIKTKRASGRLQDLADIEALGASPYDDGAT